MVSVLVGGRLPDVSGNTPPDVSGTTVNVVGDGGATLVCGAACVGAASGPDGDPHTGGVMGGGIVATICFGTKNRIMIEMIARMTYLISYV